MDLLTLQERLEILSSIARDAHERTTERIKAIELFSKIEAPPPLEKPLIIVDDIVP